MEPFNIVKVRTTIQQMMADRGYSPMPFSEHPKEVSQREKFEKYLEDSMLSLQAYNKFVESWVPVVKSFNKIAKEKGQETILPETVYGVLSRFSLFQKTKENGRRSVIWVVFSEPVEDSKVGLDDVKSLMSLLGSRPDITDSIFITNTAFGPEAQVHFDNNAPKFNLQHYFYEDLEFNPTHHTYVPEHYVLTKAEAKTFLETYKILPNQLPTMSRADVIARYYGLQPGDIVHIERKNLRGDSLVNSYSFYRRVM